MRLNETLSEAGRNLASGTSRALTSALILATVMVTIGLAEGATVGSLIKEASQFRSSGAAIMVLSADDAIDGAACERLTGLNGIDHAGAIRDTRTDLPLVALPGAPVPLKEATPGFSDLLGVTPGQPEGLGVLISEQVSVVTARGPGDVVWTSKGKIDISGIFSYPADGRSPELEYAIVSPVPSYDQRPFDQCWAEVWPTSTGRAQLLRLSLDSSVRRNAEITLSQLNTTRGAAFNGTAEFNSRPTSWAAIVSVLVGFAFGYATIRLRRLELASARHAGVPASSQLLQLTVETSAWVACAVVISAPVLLYQALKVGQDTDAALFWLQLRCSLGAASGATVGALLGTALAREHHLFRYFKER